MTAYTTPAESEAIFTRADAVAKEVARNWLRDTDGYRSTNERFLDSNRAALALVAEGVSFKAIKITRDLIELSLVLNQSGSDHYRLSRTILAEILGYAAKVLEKEEVTA